MLSSVWRELRHAARRDLSSVGYGPRRRVAGVPARRAARIDPAVTLRADSAAAVQPRPNDQPPARTVLVI
jgi:hypothetical protein